MRHIHHAQLADRLQAHKLHGRSSGHFNGAELSQRDAQRMHIIRVIALIAAARDVRPNRDFGGQLTGTGRLQLRGVQMDAHRGAFAIAQRPQTAAAQIAGERVAMERRILVRCSGGALMMMDDLATAGRSFCEFDVRGRGDVQLGQKGGLADVVDVVVNDQRRGAADDIRQAVWVV